MNRRLLDDVIHDADKQFADIEYLHEWFLEEAKEYVDEFNDPTTEQVEVLINHFAERDPRDLEEESLALMWAFAGVMQWINDDLGHYA